ncbi:hypothetical protein [Flavivirga rizhaonensis]|uniref:Uncharacterized protein n=1 Tax=Flavivirga rizhaonensis TaxID=2559571 RepID=A0A4S1DQS6_9FLAO|nr:hypothetical protein [Flavivirga rizhaonensis]TGV00246.1 hypothetical protein EM932_20445 [Flavivirga rizhaonensis]
MNFYDYYFYRMYKSTNITNKSIPEWSTIIAISILFAINLFSILISCEYPIESIGEEGFGAIPLIIVALNYFYFLFNKRYLKIIDKYKGSKYNSNLFHDTIIVTYACLSIFIIFRVLNADYIYPIGLSLFIIATSLFGYIKSKSLNNKDSDL